MAILFSLFFGAGVAAFVYTKMGKRVGFGNGKQVATLVGITFVMGTLVFYLLGKMFLHF